MLAAFGPQNWWPGDSPFEIMVGAVLVQNTAWRNVERAIKKLRDAGVMEPRALYALPPAELAELIRPAGYYQVKTRRLRNLLQFIVERYDGSLDTMFSTSLDTLRKELLFFESALPPHARLYNEYHALLVRVGKDYCRRSEARCEECPLAELLPTGGPALPID
jgi:endonuclease III related protein